MRTLFASKKFGRMLVLALALACCLAIAGCGGQKNVDTDANDVQTQDVDPVDSEPDAAAPAEEPGEPDGDSGDVVDTPRVTDIQQTDPELHVGLLKLDFEEGDLSESPYYRSTVDESGKACYEVQPMDSDGTTLLPMASTVIYMTEGHAEEHAANGDTGSFADAYYEKITLTYLLDGEPIESTQYQLYVPNVYDMSVNEMVGDANAIPAAGDLAR